MVSAADISVVSVAYNSADVLPGMLSSMPRGQEVVIVDNGPDDGARAAAAAAGAKLVVAPGNIGFGAACNLGASQASGSYLLFLNPDARLEPDTLDQLAHAALRHPDAGAFGACQHDGSGRKFYRRRTRVVTGLPSLPKAVPEVDTIVPVLSGAALMVSRPAFETVGGFDPRIFLYYEDDDLSLRLARQVGPLWFIPSARVLHIGGASSATNPALARFKGYQWGRSRVYVGRKHGRKAALFRALINGANFLLSTRSLRSAERRAEAIGRIAGAWSQRRAEPQTDMP